MPSLYKRATGNINNTEPAPPAANFKILHSLVLRLDESLENALGKMSVIERNVTA
jgi:hypothetical protein